MTNADRHGRRPRGQALVEFALISPLSFLLFIGCLDFGRVFYSAMTITHAARAGAQYGAQNNNTSGDFGGMTQAALDSAGDLTGVTVTPERFCLCADGSSVDCITGVCNPEGVPQVYVRVTAQKTFTTLFPYPGIPGTTNLNRQATVRLQ